MKNQISVLHRLSQSETLLDVLLAFEDFLDNNDIYAFKNWSLGEIFAGPKIEKYWVTVTLKYDYKNMPDPRGGMRLIKGGAKVWFEKVEVENTEINNELGLAPGFVPVANLMQRTQDVPVEKLPKKTIWLITVSIPRRFVDDVNDLENAEFMDYVQMEIIKSVRSSGIDTQTEFKDNKE